MELSGRSSGQRGRRKRLLARPLLRVEEAAEEEEGEAACKADQARGRELWPLLRFGFHHAVEKIKKAEMTTLYLSHGLQHQCRTVFASPVLWVTHDSRRRVFVVLDAAGTLNMVGEDGSCQGSERGLLPMAGLLYASEVDRFVAWGEGGLQVLDCHLQLLSQAQAARPIRCGTYSERLNRIVTAGDGNLTLWDFRHGARSLQCQSSVCSGLRPSDRFSRLALDNSDCTPQRCFASCDVGAAAFDISGGRLLSFRKELHSREITDLAYCQAIGCAITASRDTTIKVWDKDWNIQTAFVGHTAPVMAVTVYPERPLIFSASQDGTIRTWNLNTIDQVDQVHVSEPVEALRTQSSLHVFSISGHTLDLWKMNKLYSLYMPLGSAAKHLCCIDLRAVGNFPIRILCMCQDSSVRLLEAQSGTLMTSLSLDQSFQARKVAYSLPWETLFILGEQGTLLRANTATNPITVKKSYSRGLWQSDPCCLLLYCHLAEPGRAYAMWLDVREARGYRKGLQSVVLHRQDRNRLLPILGHKDGSLSVLNWSSGRIQYTLKAHNSEPVTALAEHLAQTCVLSAGADLTVKMWRLFPYAEECLLPLLCFSCASPARHMCFLGETLAVAFQDPETVTYSIVYYNLMEQTRSEHGPEDDAQDDITGLCCCPNLNLFASASRDGSVKVWDIKNRLLRHLKLNATPESLAFANPQGDLLVGLEQQLFLIHHDKYLPSFYKMQLLCAEFLEPLRDVPLPISEPGFEALVQENIRQMQEVPLKEAESFTSEARRMALKESSEIRAARIKLEDLSQLAVRDRDLQWLQDGAISPAKKVQLTRAMREEAFEQYLQIFHGKPLRVEIPEVDSFDADDVLETMGRMEPLSALQGPTLSHMFLGCFPKFSSPEIPSPAPAGVQPAPGEASLLSRSFLGISSSAVTAFLGSLSQGLQLKRKKVDIVTASLMAKEQEPPRPLPSQVAAEAGRPPLLSASTGGRAPPEAVRASPVQPEESKVSPRGLPTAQASLPPSTGTSVVGSVKSVSFKEPPSPLAREESQRRLPSPSRSYQSSVALKVIFPERLPSSKGRLRSQGELESQSFLLSSISSGSLPNSVVSRHFHSLDLQEEEKLVKVVEPQEEPEGLSGWAFAGHELPERQPSPVEKDSISFRPVGMEERLPAKQSPLEVFLTQLDESQYPEAVREVPECLLPFVDQAWFKRLFPEGLPTKMELSDFFRRLIERLFMPRSDFTAKTEMVGAIMALQDQIGEKLKGRIHNTLICLLKREQSFPTLQEEDQWRFIHTALCALLQLDRNSKDLMVELMVCYLKAPDEIRAIIRHLMEEAGLVDPHSCFFKEIDSWPLDQEDSNEVVRQFSIQWLEERMEILQEHRMHVWKQESSLRKTVSSEEPKSYIGKCQESPEQSRQEAREAAELARAAHREETDQDSDRKKYLVRRRAFQDFQKAEKRARPVQQPMRPVDAIHYFVVKRLERRVEEEADSPRDTVVALPQAQKIRAILRLGETNAMLRKRIPEHCFYFPYTFPRYVMKGFAPFVKLHLPRINLEPFAPPLERERLASPKTFTARQQLVRKYFIPRLSYADNYL